MRTHSLKRPGFTLIEMIVAITVFTIFIGFAISAFLSFHRANQDALTMRSLVMDAEALLNELSNATRENQIDYATYEAESGGGGGAFPDADLTFGDALNEEHLYLISSEGERIVYSWDSDEEALNLSVEYFDVDGNSLGDAQVLHSEGLSVTYVNFRIFPSEDPYADSLGDSSQYYQPMVTFDLNFSMPGRVTPELTLDLRTSVTSRYYQ